MWKKNHKQNMSKGERGIDFSGEGCCGPQNTEKKESLSRTVVLSFQGTSWARDVKHQDHGHQVPKSNSSLEENYKPSALSSKGRRALK